MPISSTQPSQLQITTVDCDNEEVSPVADSSSSPTSASPALSQRRPSEAATLVPHSPQSTPQPSKWDFLDAESTRFRSSSVGSMLSSATAYTSLYEVPSVQSSSESNPGTFVDRKRIFNDNTIPLKKAKSIWRLMWEPFYAKTLILLTVVAVVSLAHGLYESLGVNHPNKSPPAVDWFEFVLICVAIIIVVLVGSLNDWQKECQFVMLNAKKENCEVNVVFNEAQSASSQEDTQNDNEEVRKRKPNNKRRKDIKKEYHKLLRRKKRALV